LGAKIDPFKRFALGTVIESSDWCGAIDATPSCTPAPNLDSKKWKNGVNRSQNRFHDLLVIDN
jgi:hypothetical protein